MSLPSLHIRCHGCDYEGVHSRRPITLVYRLPNGQSVTGGRTFGWCFKCNAIRDIEERQEPVAIQKRIASLVTSHKARGFLVNLVDRALGGNPHEASEEVQELSRQLQLA